VNICLSATLKSVKATSDEVIISARFDTPNNVAEFSGRLVEITISLDDDEAEVIGRATSLMADDCNVFEINEKCMINEFILHLCRFVNSMEKASEDNLGLEISMTTNGDSIPKTSNQITLNVAYGIYGNIQWKIVK